MVVVTGSRAEYGLLSPLLDKLKGYRLIVTGSHLSPEHGYTVKKIKHPITETIECVLSSDSPVGVGKAVGLAVSSFSEAFNRLKPKAVVLLGDRYEIFAAAVAAHVANIPIVHLHAGEETTGAYDNAFRHSISYMATCYFTACEQHTKRLIAMGKSRDCIFEKGALGCDGLFPRDENDVRNYFVVIVHPETLGKVNIGNLLFLLRQRDAKKVFILPNADNGRSEIVEAVREFCSRDPSSIYHKNLPRESFIDILKRAKAIIGNSSAGIIEAPALHVPTINIGIRQHGRDLASSIIDRFSWNRGLIASALWRLDEKEYNFTRIPYSGGNVAQRIADRLNDLFR